MTEIELNFLDRLNQRSKSQKYVLLDENRYDQKYFDEAGLKNIELRNYQLHGIRWLIERYEAGHGASQ